MTNEMIIFWKSVELMNAGIIGGTGRTLVVDAPDGSTVEIAEPEPIHTFAYWKSHGFSVKKGEHAVARFTIWKGAEKVIKDEDGNETDEKAMKMFRKDSCFFTAAQVEPTVERPGEARRKGRSPAAALPVLAPVPVPVVDTASGYGNWLS